MTKRSTLALVTGLLIGFAVVASAHTGNGFETAPLVFLALVISGLGTITSGVIVFVIGKRGGFTTSVGLLSVAMFGAIVLIPVIWPYPPSPGPIPVQAVR